jgi:hypothetical protein
MGESKRGGLGSPSLIIFWLRSKSRRNNTKKRTTDRKVVRKLGTKKSVCAFHVPYSFMCLSCALGCISCAFHVPFMCLSCALGCISCAFHVPFMCLRVHIMCLLCALWVHSMCLLCASHVPFLCLSCAFHVPFMCLRVHIMCRSCAFHVP